MASQTSHTDKIIAKDEPDTDDDVEDVPDVPPREPSLLEQFAQGAVILLLAAAASPISQLSLAPVFGSVPSAVNHSTAIAVTFIAGFLVHHFTSTGTQDWLAANFREYLTVWPFWIPVLQSVMAPYTGSLGPIGGPIFQGIFCCHSVIFPSALALAGLYQDMKFGRRGGLLKSGLVLSTVLALPFINLEYKTSSWIRKFLSKYKTVTPVHLQLALATSYFLVFISWTPIFSLTVPAILHTVFFNQHLTNATVNDYLEPYNWTLIDRSWSNTGYVSVLDGANEQYRVLRVDHSLLGGEFYLTEERKVKEGWQVNESIYAVFEMMEVVRLINTKPRIPDSKAQALVVGLGIGTAPKAFIAHGINTTILELDPVVHNFATRYFALPSNHTAIIGDAVAWVETTSHSPQPHQTYDYILHDVFTGGIEPIRLFTTQFLTSLRSLLAPNGLIALNYAGDLTSPLTLKILSTISHVFAGPTNCKIYRDSPKESNGPDFLNMVIFCRRTPGPIVFRKPVERDFLGSKSRHFYMMPKAELEMGGREERGVLGEEDVRGFTAEQEKSAVRHWGIMRGVLPDAVWELW